MTSGSNAGGPFATPITYDACSMEGKRLWDEQIRDHGRMTNMKMTLARSPVALGALMTWYPLRDRVQAVLGERPTLLFAHAISAETDCLICSTFFRRILMERGENPDQLQLNGTEQALVTLGRQIAKDPNRVDDSVFTPLKARLTEDNLVDLVAFAGIMVATNIFNNVLRIPLDDYLAPFRKGK